MSKKAASKKAISEQGSEPFEHLLEAAEKAVSSLERGELSLEESLNTYEQGVRALARCYSLLEDAEKRVEVLSGGADFGWRGEGSQDGDAGAESGKDASGGDPAWRSAHADPSLKDALERIDSEKFSSSSED